MGQLYRMLILKTCPYQQILSSKGAETTNGTASQHIHINKYVDLPDGSIIQIVDSGPFSPFTFLPETTKWVAPLVSPKAVALQRDIFIPLASQLVSQ